MKTIKFTQAKTEVAKQAINLLDMYKFKSSLKDIKAQAEICGLTLSGRSFSSIYPQLCEFYEMAMVEEEAATLVVA